MSILSKLAGSRGRNDDELNKALGRNLVEAHDTRGVREIAENLHNPDKRVQTDCLSVLEQVGRLDPGLVEDYVAEFIELIFSKDNHLVWSAMIDLALIADRKPHEIFERYDEIVEVIEKGSVITKDNGIKTLAIVASADAQYKGTILPYLLGQLKSCRPKSLPQYAESIQPAVDADSQDEYVDILNARLIDLSEAQQRRVKKLLKSY
jgi:hypothetical protein